MVTILFLSYPVSFCQEKKKKIIGRVMRFFFPLRNSRMRTEQDHREVDPVWFPLTPWGLGKGATSVSSAPA